MTREGIRLYESPARKQHWERWGPYLSERAWGTYFRDYRANGDAWEYFPTSCSFAGLSVEPEPEEWMCPTKISWNIHAAIQLFR